MSRDDLFTSAVFAIALGAMLVWIGSRMLRRPVQTTEKMLEFVRGGRSLPAWARPHPDVVRPAIRVQGAFLAVLGVAVLALGVYQWWASRT